MTYYWKRGPVASKEDPHHVAGMAAFFRDISPRHRPTIEKWRREAAAAIKRGDWNARKRRG